MNLKLNFPNKPRSIFVIGDSHSLIYTDVLVSNNNGIDEQFYLFKVKYIGGLIASKFVSDNGSLDQNVVNAMLNFGLLKPDAQRGLVARHKTPALNSSETYENKYGSADPVILFSVGELDIRNNILKQLADNFDFTIPNFNFFEFPNKIKPALISYDLVKNLYEQISEPLLKGLIGLRNLGFDNTFLLLPPPSPPNDDTFFALNEFTCSANLRTKVHYSFNQHLKEKLSRFALKYIDIWNFVTTNNVLNEDYLLDSCHLNSKASKIVIGELIAKISNE